MRRWILAGAIMALLTVVALAGCRAPVYVMRVEAQSGVRWDGYYGVARKAVNGAVHDKLRISGNGGWELALPQDAGVIQGLVLSVTKQGQDGVLRVLIPQRRSRDGRGRGQRAIRGSESHLGKPTLGYPVRGWFRPISWPFQAIPSTAGHEEPRRTPGRRRDDSRGGGRGCPAARGLWALARTTASSWSRHMPGSSPRASSRTPSGTSGTVNRSCEVAARSVPRPETGPADHRRSGGRAATLANPSG